MLRAGVASALTAAALLLAATLASAEPLSCSLAGYRAQTGLTASLAKGALALQWSGDRGQELRARFVLTQGTPTIEELAVRPPGGTWGVVAANVVADYRVTTGLRRSTSAPRRTAARIRRRPQGWRTSPGCRGTGARWCGRPRATR